MQLFFILIYSTIVQLYINCISSLPGLNLDLLDLVDVLQIHDGVRPLLVLLTHLVPLLHVEQHLAGGARRKADVEKRAERILYVHLQIHCVNLVRSINLLYS